MLFEKSAFLSALQMQWLILMDQITKPKNRPGRARPNNSAPCTDQHVCNREERQITELPLHTAIIQERCRKSTCIHRRNISAKFHPDPIWNEWALGLFPKWRHGRHLESMTSYPKSDSVHGCAFTMETIVPNFIPIGFEMMELYRLFVKDRPKKKKNNNKNKYLIQKKTNKANKNGRNKWPTSALGATGWCSERRCHFPDEVDLHSPACLPEISAGSLSRHGMTRSE